MRLSRIAELLLVVFLTLKLAGVVVWSWWWVLSPAWGFVAAGFVVGFLRAWHKEYRRQTKVTQ